MITIHPKDYLNNTLKAFQLNAWCSNFSQIRNISIFDLQLAPGTRVKELQNYSNELALSLRANNKPYFRIIPEKGIVKMEITHQTSVNFNLFPLFHSLKIPNSGLQFYLGNSTSGDDIWLNLIDAPHILLAGSTGSGKSTLLHCLIANAVKHHNINIHIFDTKDVEYTDYPNIFPQIQLATTYEKILQTLKSIYNEMENRYQMLRFDKDLAEKLPYILIIIDEFADLILQDQDKELYKLLCGLAQKCRAAKIHIVLGTQRPSVDIIRGSIKANFPTRIALRTSSGTDSRIILDANGAEVLNGNGDAIIKSTYHPLIRFQVPFTTPEEVQKNV